MEMRYLECEPSDLPLRTVIPPTRFRCPAGNFREVAITIHFIKIPNVDEERLDDVLILLHPETLELRFLNETAAVLWDALGELPTVQDLTGLLGEARPDVSSV